MWKFRETIGKIAQFFGGIFFARINFISLWREFYEKYNIYFMKKEKKRELTDFVSKFTLDICKLTFGALVLGGVLSSNADKSSFIIPGAIVCFALFIISMLLLILKK